MNATKILWGQIILVSFVVLGFVWAATEWTAWCLGFQPQLGQPWFELFGWPVYQPQDFFWWWFSFGAYAPHVFCRRGGYIAAGGGVAAVAVATTLSVMRAREAKRVTTYGSARWAETREIREASLLGDDGVLLGRWRDDYLRHDGPEACPVLCPDLPEWQGRVGLVVPTLLTWPGSAIVHDIKGENWTLTAGWRARFGRVLLFDPTNARSAAYNPLLGGAARRVWKCATSKTSPMCWSTPKARWRSAIIGRRPATRCWSARSCMCCTPNPTRPWQVSPTFCPIQSVRSRPPCAQ